MGVFFCLQQGRMKVPVVAILSLLFLLAAAQPDIPEELHRVCCVFGDDNDADDQHWHILIPAASTTECHHSFMNDFEAVLPDYHGWAWEVNSCFLAGTLSACNEGCDDGDANDDDNDDSGGGTNSPLDRFTDAYYSAGDPFISNGASANHDVNCIYWQVDRTWISDTVCRSPPAGRISDIQVIRLLDTTPPFVGGAPDVTLECFPDIASSIDQLAGFPTAYDSCENNIQLGIETQIDGNTCTRTFSRTYTTSGNLIPDCALNTVQYTQTIVVQDTRPPVVTGDLEFDVECSNVPDSASTAPLAVDGCNGVVTPTPEPSREIQGECTGTYTLLREYNVADTCGNSEIHTVVVNVEDTTAPVIQVMGGGPAPASSVVRTANNCPPVFNSFEAVDNCAAVTEVVFTQDVVIIRSEENRYNYVAQQQVYASDPCGNTDTRVYEYIVEGDPLVTLELDGPVTPVSKAAPFAVNVVLSVSNGCPTLQNQFIVAVDVGAAVLQSSSVMAPAACTQRGNGVVYCENLPATVPDPFTVTLNLIVPSNYLPDSLLLRAVSEYETSGIVVPASGNDRTALVRFI